MAETGKPIMYGRGGAGNVTTKDKVGNVKTETTPTQNRKYTPRDGVEQETWPATIPKTPMKLAAHKMSTSLD